MNSCENFLIRFTFKESVEIDFSQQFTDKQFPIFGFSLSNKLQQHPKLTLQKSGISLLKLGNHWDLNLVESHAEER